MNDSTPDNNEQPLTGQTPSDTRPPLVLVTDVITPRPDQDSGSMDTVHYIRMLMELGYETVFCPYDLTHDGEYTYALQNLGVRCLHKPETESLQEHLAAYGNLYDILFLNRLQHAGDLMTDIRRHCNNARKIFNTVDLHFLREQRQAKAEDSNELLDKAEETRQIELELMRQCDATILISEVEKRVVLEEDPDLNVVAIPYIREVRESISGYNDRRDIIFIGGFRFQPNIDAVKWFASEIWPDVHRKLPNAKFLIVGSNMPDEVIDLGNLSGVEIVGFVQFLSPLLDRCRLSVAPLRFGAGIKGKIGTSITHGVPCVATSIAAEGMGLKHKVHTMIADDPEQFANAVVKTYKSRWTWNRLSKNGLELFKQNYSYARGLDRFRALLENIK